MSRIASKTRQLLEKRFLNVFRRNSANRTQRGLHYVLGKEVNLKSNSLIYRIGTFM